MVSYIAIYQKLAPVVEKASKYYDRKDYKSDKFAGAKEFHKQIAEYAPEFTKERKRVDALLGEEKAKIDLAELDALEKAEGKKANWQVRNVMMRANAVVELLPENEKPVVDMEAFGKAMDTYAAAVREMDDYATEHPNSFHVFESRPASLLGKLRDFRKSWKRPRAMPARVMPLLIFSGLLVITTPWFRHRRAQPFSRRINHPSDTKAGASTPAFCLQVENYIRRNARGARLNRPRSVMIKPTHSGA